MSHPTTETALRNVALGAIMDNLKANLAAIDPEIELLDGATSYDVRGEALITRRWWTWRAFYGESNVHQECGAVMALKTIESDGEIHYNATAWKGWER